MPGNCAFMSKPFEAVEQPNNDYWTCLSSAKEQEKLFGTWKFGLKNLLIFCTAITLVI